MYGDWKHDQTLRVDGCVKWRQTGQCRADGIREPKKDKECNEEIKWQSGYCECTNDRTEMLKGCELPSYYGHKYATCEEACAHRGVVANDLVPGGDIQSDQPNPIDENPETSRRPIYQINGDHGWTCSSILKQTYTTYEEASRACSDAQRCSFVLDEGCNKIGPFKLCSAMSFVEASSEDCLIYKKWN